MTHGWPVVCLPPLALAASHIPIGLVTWNGSALHSVKEVAKIFAHDVKDRQMNSVGTRATMEACLGGCVYPAADRVGIWTG